MRGVFDDKDFKAPASQRDTELTLGVGALLLVVCGFLLICVLCFGLGYAVGHRGGQSTSATGQAAAAGAQPSLPISGSPGSGSRSKPSATAQPVVPGPAQNAPPQGVGSQPGATGLPQSAAAAAVPKAALPASNSAALQSAPLGQLQVRPAFPSAASGPQTASASSAQPAVPPAASVMVQIAAVSNDEDAEVLVGALRKHGYEVSARRDPADNLIHVRIGPFNDRNEADRWRQKLLDDGYNAIVQP